MAGGVHGGGVGVCMAGGHVWWGACMVGGMCSIAMEGGPFSVNLLPKLAISHNMMGIQCITQL